MYTCMVYVLSLRSEMRANVEIWVLTMFHDNESCVGNLSGPSTYAGKW